MNQKIEDEKKFEKNNFEEMTRGNSYYRRFVKWKS